MTDTQGIKDRIRKLLNVSKENSGATDGEIDNAVRFAQALMMRHHLTAADIDDGCSDEEVRLREAQMRAEDIAYGTADIYSHGSKLSDWETTLAWAIADVIGSVRWYFQTRVIHQIDGIAQLRDGKPETRTKITFYGPAEDVRIARELMAEWTITIAGMALMRWGGCFRGPGRSYCEGFATALLNKVGSVQKEQLNVATNIGGRALLIIETTNKIVERKRHRADDWLKSQGINLKQRSRGYGGRHFDDAHAQGRTDGEKANISAQRNAKLGHVIRD